MAYKNKTYICFDADTDMHWYRLMTAWKQNDDTDFNFYDAHDLNNIWANSTEETIKRRLRERLVNTKTFIILIGEKTRHLYKYVRWEAEYAVEHDLPIIAVNLNKKRRVDADRCPPIVRDNLAIHIAFGLHIVQYALDRWETRHAELRKAGEAGNYHYPDSVYKQLVVSHTRS